MMKRTIYFIIFITYMTDSTWSELCNSVGLRCSDDGKRIIICLEKDAESMDVKECSDQCKAKDGSVKCVDASDKDLRFECSMKGEFPDPTNCNRTFICNSDTGQPAKMCECPSGHFVYPEHGLFCVPQTCPHHNINCKSGKFGHFQLTNGLSTSFYYFCKEDDVVTVYGDVEVKNYKWSLNMVKNGTQALNIAMKDGKKCVQLQASTSTGAPPTSTPPVTRPPNYLPTCRLPWQKFPAECDCYYYICNRHLQPVRRTCYIGQRFCAFYNLCVFGECDESKCRRPKHV